MQLDSGVSITVCHKVARLTVLTTVFGIQHNLCLVNITKEMMVTWKTSPPGHTS